MSNDKKAESMYNNNVTDVCSAKFLSEYCLLIVQQTLTKKKFLNY